MKHWFWIAIILGVAASAQAQSPAELLKQARDAYDKGEFAAAISAYQSLLQQGLESSELYYNLGNAEFKAGHIGRAIASYRRALKRSPEDEDIRANLDYVRSFVNQPRTGTGNPLVQLGNQVLTWFSGQTLAVLALIVYWALAFLAAWLVLSRGGIPAVRWVTAGVSLVFLFLAGWASLRIVLDRTRQWGVVVASRAEARNGPKADYQIGFVVPEGREVRVLGREGDWIAIGLPQEGYKGWIQSSEILMDE